MGRFRIQLLLEDNTWSTRYNIAKNDRYSDTSTDWTLPNLIFTVEKYGIRTIYDQIDTPHADMCFSNIAIPHSVCKMDNSNYFKDLFESIPNYKKIVLIIFLIQNDKDLLHEIGFSERDNNRINLEFKNILKEGYDEYLEYIRMKKNQ